MKCRDCGSVNHLTCAEYRTADRWIDFYPDPRRSKPKRLFRAWEYLLAVLFVLACMAIGLALGLLLLGVLT